MMENSNDLPKINSRAGSLDGNCGAPDAGHSPARGHTCGQQLGAQDDQIPFESCF